MDSDSSSSQPAVSGRPADVQNLNLEGLPDDLQSYLLSFAHARNLVRGFGGVNSHWKGLVDGHVKRRVWNHLDGTAKRDARGSRSERSRLVFSACRPIDTMTAKHLLHFSHFSQSQSNQVGSDSKSGSTVAHFSFLLPPAPALGGELSSISINAFDAPQGGFDPVRGIMDFMAYRDRMGEREHSSSVFESEIEGGMEGAGPGVSTPRRKERGRDQMRRTPISGNKPPSNSTGQPSTSSSNDTSRLFTSVSNPFTSTSDTAQLVPDDQDGMDVDYSEKEAEEDASSGDSEEERGGNSDNINQPLHAYDWAGPVTSSLSQEQEHLKRRKTPMKPTYKFELDPLDSFETWILNLTIHKPHSSTQYSMSSNHSSLSTPSQSLSTQFSFMPRFGGFGTERAIRLGTSSAIRGGMRWEKKVVEGLDRIYREWHLVDPLNEEQVDNAVEIPNSKSKESKHKTEEKTKSSLPTPISRILEFDDSCVLQIQPHPIAREKIPSSFSSYDSGFASSSYSYGNSGVPYGYGYGFPLSHREELSQSKTSLTFHCEEIRINAARLLSVLEDLERLEMLEADKELDRFRKPGGGSIVGGVANYY